MLSYPPSLCCCDPGKPEARIKKATVLKPKTNNNNKHYQNKQQQQKTLKLLCFPAKFTKSPLIWTSFPNFSLSKAFSVSCLWRLKRILELIIVCFYKNSLLESQNNIPRCFSPQVITCFPYKQPTSGFTSNMVSYHSDSSHFW